MCLIYRTRLLNWPAKIAKDSSLVVITTNILDLSSLCACVVIYGCAIVSVLSHAKRCLHKVNVEQ